MKSPHGNRWQNIEGVEHNYLTPVEYLGKSHWNCLCRCGNHKKVKTSHLKAGLIKSCGCFREECKTTHGMSKSPEYSTWECMWQRCTNPNAEEYENYGGRGITICPEWKEFEQFYKNMGPRPGKGYSIERINTNGNYEPSNCVWATNLEQGANTRKNRKLTAFGTTLHLSEWARRLNIHKNTLAERLKKQNLENIITVYRPKMKEVLTCQSITQESEAGPPPTTS